MTPASVSVVGLGKLGLCLAACFAHKGIKTIGVDVQEGVVAAINSGKTPLVEPRMDELIASLGGTMLKATLDHAEAIEHTDITFVLTATPSNPDGTFSNAHVEAALTSLAQAFGKSGKKFHTFVISSTVVPESINSSFIPLLERESGKRLHDDFDVCFDPDFVALGNVVHDFLNPDLVIIGESSPGAGLPVEAIHKAMCENDPPIARMSLVSAEIAKVSLNAYITMKISFANTVANICERIPGADVDAITSAIGKDKRISPYYFKGGLGFGGTCFPRDTKAFMAIATKYGIEPELIRAADKVNQFQDSNLTARVLDHVQPGSTVGIIGLSFKPDTPVITESAAIKLIQGLLERAIRVVVFDSLANEVTRELFGNTLYYAETVEECIAMSNVCVLTHATRQLKNIMEQINYTEPLVVIDCWRCLDLRNDFVNVIKMGTAQTHA
jgi:UDPglucose 6-dehydrogenase